MASSTGGINSEAKWFGSILEKASRSDSKSVVTISVSRRAIFSVRKGTTPCQPNSPYGASSNRCKSSPRYSRGTNIIFTPIQFVTKPTPAATVGMRANAPGLAATSWPIRVRRPAGCCAAALKDARCRQRAPRCRIARDSIVDSERRADEGLGGRGGDLGGRKFNWFLLNSTGYGYCTGTGGAVRVRVNVRYCTVGCAPKTSLWCPLRLMKRAISKSPARGAERQNGLKAACWRLLLPRTMASLLPTQW